MPTTKESVANKSTLVEEIAKRLGSTKAEATRNLEAMLESVSHLLSKKHRIALIGFGTFKVTERKATTGRNPRTGQPIKIAASKQVKFSAGKLLKDAVNH
jgi:DNA-binding protein HU-beta